MTDLAFEATLPHRRPTRPWPRRPPDPHLPARYDQSVDSSPLPHRNRSPLDPRYPSAGNGSRSDPEPPSGRLDARSALEPALDRLNLRTDPPPPGRAGQAIHPLVGRAGNGFPGALPDPSWRSSDRGGGRR